LNPENPHGMTVATSPLPELFKQFRCDPDPFCHYCSKFARIDAKPRLDLMHMDSRHSVIEQRGSRRNAIEDQARQPMDEATVIGKKYSLARMLDFFGLLESRESSASVGANVCEGHAGTENPAIRKAPEKFSTLLFQSEAVLDRANRVDLEDCVRILGVYCAQYRSRYGDLPLSGTTEILTSGSMDDDQKNIVADGLGLVVNILGLMEEPPADSQRPSSRP
jgi:hypothetical protein